MFIEPLSFMSLSMRVTLIFWVGLNFSRTDLSLSVNRPSPFEMSFLSLSEDSAGESILQVAKEKCLTVAFRITFPPGYFSVQLSSGF